jgi:hypothetical protein
MISIAALLGPLTSTFVRVIEGVQQFYDVWVTIQQLQEGYFSLCDSLGLQSYQNQTHKRNPVDTREV